MFSLLSCIARAWSVALVCLLVVFVSSTQVVMANNDATPIVASDLPPVHNSNPATLTNDMTALYLAKEALQNSLAEQQTRMSAMQNNLRSLRDEVSAATTHAPSSSSHGRTLLNTAHPSYDASVLDSCSPQSPSPGFIKMFSNGSSTGVLFNCETSVHYADGAIYVDQVAFSGGGNIATPGPLNAGGVSLAGGAVNGVSMAGGLVDGVSMTQFSADIAAAATELAAQKAAAEGVAAFLVRVGGPQWKVVENTPWCPLEVTTSAAEFNAELSACFLASAVDPNDLYPFTFTLLGNSSLPAGLVLQADGTVTGTLSETVVDTVFPGDAISVPLTLRVANSVGIMSESNQTVHLHLWRDLSVVSPPGTSGFGRGRVGLSYNASVMLVGAPGGVIGSAHLYHFDEATRSFGNGSTMNDALYSLNGDEFGFHTRLSDDGLTALVSIPMDDDVSFSAGAAAFFRRASLNESFVDAQLVYSSDATSKFYSMMGIDLSADGTVGFVSDSNYMVNFDNGGAVDVWRLNPVTGLFERDQVVTASTDAQDLYFGSRVKTTSDGLYFAASTSANNGQFESVHVFKDYGSSFTEIAVLDPEPCQGLAHVWDLSLSDGGALLTVGRDRCGYYRQGVVYVYRFNVGDNSYELIQEVSGDDSVREDDFGGSQALNRDGTILVAGAPGHDSLLGAAYVFTWVDEVTMFKQTRKVVRASPSGVYGLGSGVIISGDGKMAAVGHTATVAEVILFKL